MGKVLLTRGLVALLSLCCGCRCSVCLPHDAVGWSAAYDCGISWSNVGHFGHGHFGLGRFGPDISATKNAKGGRFGQIINFGLGCVHA